MLRISDITKDYIVSKELTVHALRGVSLNLRNSEFVSILGPSGCGKTTLLNIIGGLDGYSSGDLQIDGKSTADFGGSDWDTYRSSMIGFVFQSYNLIPNMNVLDNVALSLSVAGENRRTRIAKAKEALAKVGLSQQLKKYPNQLSGGQMQRVAIARAIVNNPRVILADEPTGALDSETGTQVMELLKEISADRLVLVVTHNRELAEAYSTRIVTMSDGRIISDSDPCGDGEAEQTVAATESAAAAECSCQNGGTEAAAASRGTRTKKSRLSVLTAFRMSLKNLKVKLGRTILTSFAGSIGIFGIALVLATSLGMGKYVDYMQTEAVGDSAVTIGETAYSVSRILSVMEDAGGVNETPYPDIDGVIPYQRQSFSTTTTLSEEFIEYIRNMNPAWTKTVNFSYSLNMHVLQKTESGGGYVYRQLTSWASNAYQMIEQNELIEDNYSVLCHADGTTGYPSDIREVSLVVDKFNRINPNVLTAIGIPYGRDAEGNYLKVAFSDIVGKEYEIILNDGWYTQNANGTFGALSGNIAEETFNAIPQENKLKIKIISVLRAKNNSSTLWLNSGLAYLPELSEFMVQNATASKVGMAQLASPETNVLTGRNFTRPEYGTEEEKDAYVHSQQISALKSLGAYKTPTNVRIYPRDIDSKQLISSYIEDWNKNHPDSEVSYLDLTGLALTVMATFIDVVSYVLVAFSAISLIVSTVMISVITYTSVIERVRVIGVLRSIGARKRDITRLFNTETLLIGTFAGVLGVGLALACGALGNFIISRFLGVASIVQFTWGIVLGMLALSVVLTLLAGLIPAIIAARKDPVQCLRSE